MINNPFKLKITGPKNNEAEKYLSNFNKMLIEKSDNLLVDQIDLQYFLYFETLKNDS